MALSVHPALYGIPAEVIRDVCGVSLRQAKAYKSGRACPHPAVIKLVVLYSEGRILDDAWTGWQAHGGELFNPEGNRYTQGMLRAYAFVWQLARELARGDAVLTAAFDSYADMGMERVKRERRRKRPKDSSLVDGSPAMDGRIGPRMDRRTSWDVRAQAEAPGERSERGAPQARLVLKK